MTLAERPTEATTTRILDATLALLADQGLSRLALEDVATTAGVSRQTVYRHFGNRTGLLEAVVLREEEAFISTIVSAAAPHGDVRDAMEAAIHAALTAARAHPLLDRLLADEPEALLPYLTTGATPVLEAANPTLSSLLRQRLPDASDAAVRRAADVLTRLVISYAINPTGQDPALLAGDLADLLTGGLRR